MANAPLLPAFSRRHALKNGLALGAVGAIGTGTGITSWAVGAKGAAPAAAATLALPKAKNLVPLPAHPNGTAWPTKDWTKGSLSGEKQALVEAHLNGLIGGSVPESGQNRAVLVIHQGKLIAESYDPTIRPDQKLVSWSMAKSFTAALVGVAMKQGKLTLDTPLSTPYWGPDAPQKSITLKAALAMCDGLHWREDGYDDVLHNDATQMLFGKGRENIVAFAAKRGQEHQPGEFWRYNSGTTNLIGATIARALGPAPLDDPTRAHMMRNFLMDELALKIGMNSTAPEFDVAGNFYASSFVHATARDWAKFGYLFLRDGVWDGQRLLPEGFVDYVRTPATDYLPAKGADHYGAHFWLSPANGTGILKHGPFDSFEAHGYKGQVIMTIPSKDLVIVRLAQMDAEWSVMTNWFEQLISYF